MKFRSIAALGMLVMLLAGCTSIPVEPEQTAQAPMGAKPADFSGYWEGNLDIGQPVPLTIAFTFNSPDETGAAVALLHIPQQGLRNFEVPSSIIDGRTVTVDMTTLMASYEGTFNPQTDMIEGVFNQMGQSLKLNLARTTQQEQRKIQDPQPPYPYGSEDLRFVQSPEGFHLAGTITRPAGEGPFPAVVLISGSGSQNRDEELFGHRPFLVLADALTRAGIVVLRYDDRGFADSEGDASFATTFDLANDAESALKYLATLPYVDSGNIGLIGHSEGAIIAPIVAQRNQAVSFLVLLAGSGVDGIKTLEDQTAAILRSQNAPEEVIAQVVATNLAVYHTIVDESKPLDERKEAVMQMMSGMGMPEAEVSAQVEALFSPWYMNFLSLDPSKYLSKVTAPVMIMNGSKDTQVSASLHVPAIESALHDAGNSKVVTKVYEGLNHLFQPAVTGGVEEYAEIDITIDPQVLADIVWWINEGKDQL